MKPLYVGLLVVGAALAAILAVTLTPPLPIPKPAPAAAPAVAPVSPGVSRPAAVSPSVMPRVNLPTVKKPSPMPRAAAPAPVYDEPATTPIRKNKPILTAGVKPTQWTPARYETPAGSPKAPPAALQPAPTPSPPAHAVASAVVEKPTPVVEKPAPAAEKPAVEKKILPAPRQVTLRAGMTIPVRFTESLSSDKNMTGDTFQASLAEPLVVDGLVIAERGARVTGRIADSEKAGRTAGIARLELELATLATSDGQRISLSTDRWTKLGDIPQATRGIPANVPSETLIRFRVASRVTITEQQLAAR